MNEKTAIDINTQALSLLSEGKFFEAQTLFRRNVKNYPSLMTFNNMGVFYMEEGLNKSDDTCRSAGSLSMLYLKKALKFQKSKLTYCALGRLCFTMNNYSRKENDYQGALEYYNRASEMGADYTTLFNYGVVLYALCKFLEASEYFCKALRLCDNVDLDEIFLAYSVALIYAASPKMRTVCHEAVDRNIEIWDKFMITYLCGNLDLSQDYAEEMFGVYSPNSSEMAILFDCLFKLGKLQEAEKYLELKITSLQNLNCNTEREIQKIRKSFSIPEYRSEVVAEYKYTLSLLGQCCYFGCKLHNNGPEFVIQ
jgi:tetratricopeptide (TPR) repeat protein